MEGELPALQEHPRLIEKEHLFAVNTLIYSQSLLATVANSTLKIHVGTFIKLWKILFWEEKSLLIASYGL